MKLTATVMTILAGAALPLQTLVNARLSTSVGGSLPASLITFIVGALVLLLTLAVVRPALPNMSAVQSIPWYAWTGGLLGAFFVVTTTLTVPLLGATLLLALLLFGQLGAGLALDHFAVLTDVARPMSMQKLAGLGLLLLGVVLIARG